MIVKRFDHVGETFGRLTVLERAEDGPWGNDRWRCLCSCGAATTVTGNNLRKQETRSCGCLSADSASKRLTTHGHTRGGRMPTTYRTWATMRSRCGNPNAKNYGRYGGRGIKVCERWSSFENFLEDMGERPEGTSLDRIENDGNYDPGNCRWATRKEQQRNTRRNRLVTFDGQTRCLSAWSEMLGLSRSTLHARLRLGWSVSDAFVIPKGGKRRAS
jgi:hypothetical protein